jgi:hypothetical protein
VSKACTGCGEVKSLPDFPKMGKNRDGSQRFNAACKSCVKPKNDAYYRANTARLKDKARDHHAANREVRNARASQRRDRIARIRAAQRRYNMRNRVARNAASQRWRDANRGHLAAYYVQDAQRRAEYQREWRRSNPERIREYRKNTTQSRGDYLTQWRKTQNA